MCACGCTHTLSGNAMIRKKPAGGGKPDSNPTLAEVCAHCGMERTSRGVYSVYVLTVGCTHCGVYSLWCVCTHCGVYLLWGVLIVMCMYSLWGVLTVRCTHRCVLCRMYSLGSAVLRACPLCDVTTGCTHSVGCTLWCVLYRVYSLGSAVLRACPLCDVTTGIMQQR